MRMKFWKLAVAVILFAGSFSLGIAPKPAHALACGPICCDPDCLSVRYCYGTAGNCICQAYCTAS